MVAEDIILKPLLTEKGYDGIADKKYTFIVMKSANKTQIKLAVEKLFGVDVKSVNTVNSRANSKEWAETKVTDPTTRRLSFSSKPIRSRLSSSIRCRKEA